MTCKKPLLESGNSTPIVEANQEKSTFDPLYSGDDKGFRALVEYLIRLQSASLVNAAICRVNRSQSTLATLSTVLSTVKGEKKVEGFSSTNHPMSDLISSYSYIPFQSLCALSSIDLCDVGNKLLQILSEVNGSSPISLFIPGRLKRLYILEKLLRLVLISVLQS